MPSITAVPYPTLLNVRVEINWADVTQATHATVWRVDCVTGERSQLHPYVAYNGDGYLLLSCGQALFWDTEAPLDKCFYYCTTAQDSAGNEVTTAAGYLYSDTFTRTVVDGWGTADTGQTYTLAGGAAPGDYDVNGSQGTFTITSNNVQRTATVNSLSEPNGTLYGYYKHPVVPTGAGHEMGVRARFVDGNNFVDLRLFLNTGNNITIAIRQVAAGVETALVGFPGVAYAGGGLVAADEAVNYRLDFWGNILRAKVWPAVEPEPVAYLATTTVTFLTAGSASYTGFTNPGSTNVLPITLKFDTHLLVDPCADLVVIEQCTTEMTLASNGVNMLRDPLNPCHDRQVVMCWTANPVCVPGQGIFFARMEDQDYPSRSGALNPSNSALPVPVIRQRGGPDSTLVLVTRSFVDRDAVVNLNRPGTVLLWQSPPAYGIADRYMGVGPLGEGRYNTDHRYQPRVMTLPHVSMDRPEGPANGVCGAQVSDLCDIYSSWDALIAAGLTWMDLLRGAASTDIPDLGERTWADVNSTYASWTAVNAGNTNWTDLLNGP